MAEKKITADIDEDDEIVTTNEDDDESGKKTTKKIDDEGADDDDDSDSDEDDDEDDGTPPPVRKSVAQHIITRQKKTIEKLRSKTVEDDDSDEDDDADLDDEPNADDKKASKVIGREVQKHLAPVIGALASNADENELQELIAKEPDAKKYEKTIRKYMAHEQYQGVPPAVIFHHLAFSKAAETTTKKKAAADLETRQSRGAGSGRRPTKPAGDLPSLDDLEDMDDAAFEKLQHKARTGKFVKKDE